MDNILPWYTLKSIPGIGNILFKRLIDHFKSPQAVFEAPERELLKIEGLSSRLVSALKRAKTPDWARRDFDIAIQKGYQIITQSDPSYPPLLHQIPDPPPFFYVFGQFTEKQLHIAMIGSRHASRYGLSTAYQLSYSLASQDIVIVSGMARGIDTAGHQGALAAKGKTVAILGSGLEKIYPPENRSLFQRIGERGAVVSEFPLLANPEPHHFPIRNRLISGICHGTVVVEAGQKSGSLITARLAAEQNREVFAVPGDINSFRSRGTHALIKQGAKLVEKSSDVTEEFDINIGFSAHRESNSPQPKEKTDQLTTDERLILNKLEPYPIHMDELTRIIKMDIGRLAGLLLQLEIKGLVAQTPGKFFCRMSDISSSHH